MKPTFQPVFRYSGAIMPRMIRLLVSVTVLVIMAHALVPLDPARAALVEFSFSGTLTEVNPALSVTFSIGQSFTGTYSFDPNTPNANAPGDPNGASYVGAPQAIQATIGSYQLTLGPFPPPIGTGEIDIQTSPQGGKYQVLIYTQGPPTVANFSSTSFALSLLDQTGTALGSTALTAAPPNLAAFQDRTVYFGFSQRLPFGGTETVTATGTLTALTPIPLPGPVWLFGSGLFALLGLRGRRA